MRLLFITLLNSGKIRAPRPYPKPKFNRSSEKLIHLNSINELSKKMDVVLLQQRLDELIVPNPVFINPLKQNNLSFDKVKPIRYKCPSCGAQVEGQDLHSSTGLGNFCSNCGQRFR